MKKLKVEIRLFEDVQVELDEGKFRQYILEIHERTGSEPDSDVSMEDIVSQAKIDGDIQITEDKEWEVGWQASDDTFTLEDYPEKKRRKAKKK